MEDLRTQSVDDGVSHVIVRAYGRRRTAILRLDAGQFLVALLMAYINGATHGIVRNLLDEPNEVRYR